MIKHINEDKFKEEVLDSDKIMLVDFFATWCMPCKLLGENLEELVTDTDDFDIAKIDIDENSNLAEEYNVEVVPTMMLFKNGEMVKRMEGLRDKQQIISEIEALKN